ncbi:MAG: DNA/RNA nuclease SfsA, partial [Treponemataceae bacterium]|nr:DNA/RNA nuclease SfsA [Treponemataceae bacterium]
DGKPETVHVKNTGRCKELLLPDTVVYLEESGNPARRTKYDLVAVEKVPQKAGPGSGAGVGDSEIPCDGRGTIGDSAAAGVRGAVCAGRGTIGDSKAAGVCGVARDGRGTIGDSAAAGVCCAHERGGDIDVCGVSGAFSGSGNSGGRGTIGDSKAAGVCGPACDGRGTIGDSAAAGVCCAHERGGQNSLLVNMDSQAPNKVAQEWIRSHPELFPKITLLKPEYSLGDSRFDFYLEYDDETGRHHKKLIEVKGCTLEKDGAALFPDAPTLRGLKHMQELTSFQKQGEYEAMVLIIVQMRGCKYFAPNRETQPAFADALREAERAGVEVMAVECDIKPDSIEAGEFIEVRV